MDIDEPKLEEKEERNKNKQLERQFHLIKARPSVEGCKIGYSRWITDRRGYFGKIQGKKNGSTFAYKHANRGRQSEIFITRLTR